MGAGDARRVRTQRLSDIRNPNLDRWVSSLPHPEINAISMARDISAMIGNDQSDS